MRILFITTYFEPDSGAAAVRLSRLAHLLQKRGHEITVLTTMPHYPQGQIAEGYRGKFSVVENRDGIRVIRTWLYATPNKRISRRLLSQISFMIMAIIRGFALKRPDVIFIEAQPVFTSLAGRLLSFFKRRPYVLNVSDLWPDHLASVGILSETHLIYRVARKIVDSGYRSADAVIGLHQFLSDKIIGYSRREDHIHTIYNGVDLKRFTPNIASQAFREKHDLSAKYLIIFIGTFATAYNFPKILQVSEYFKDRDDVMFVLIGQGSQETIVEDYFTQSHDNIKWLGWIAHDETPEAWAASHVGYWVMRDNPLYQGTIPAKLYEAFASGVPLAVGTEGIASTLINENQCGIAVSCNDIDALVQAVTRLLDDDDFHQACAKSARDYAETNFDPERVADAYENVFQGVIQA